MKTSLTYEKRICQFDFIWERFENISWFLKMTHYTNVKMRISEGQKDKLKKAFESNCESIAIRFKFSDLHGEDLNQFTTWQTSGGIWRKERLDNKNVNNAISPQHWIEGEFLPALAGLIPFLTGTVLPALGVEALSGPASKGVQTLIGNGLYLKKGGGVWDRNWWRRAVSWPNKR